MIRRHLLAIGVVLGGALGGALLQPAVAQVIQYGADGMVEAGGGGFPISLSGGGRLEGVGDGILRLQNEAADPAVSGSGTLILGNSTSWRGVRLIGTNNLLQIKQGDNGGFTRAETSEFLALGATTRTASIKGDQGVYTEQGIHFAPVGTNTATWLRSAQTVSLDYATGDWLNLSAGSGLQFGGATKISSSVDGILTVTNNAGTAGTFQAAQIRSDAPTTNGFLLGSTLRLLSPAGGELHVSDATNGGKLVLDEVTAPTGTTDQAKIYVDNGGPGGKSRLMVIFQSGAAQVIASEP